MLEDPELIFMAIVKNGQTIAIIVEDHSLTLAVQELGLFQKHSNYSQIVEPRSRFSPNFVYHTALKATSLQIACYSSSFELLNSRWSNGHELNSAAYLLAFLQ